MMRMVATGIQHTAAATAVGTFHRSISQQHDCAVIQSPASDEASHACDVGRERAETWVKHFSLLEPSKEKQGAQTDTPSANADILAANVDDTAVDDATAVTVNGDSTLTVNDDSSIRSTLLVGHASDDTGSVKEGRDTLTKLVEWVFGTWKPTWEIREHKALQFSRVRRASGILEDDYRSSFLRGARGDLVTEKLSEGKSGMFMYFSDDRKFILKQIVQSEFLSLMQLLPSYCEYIEQNWNSKLVRFYGCHSLVMQHQDPIWFVSMNNIFFGAAKPREVFDLKGAWTRRHAIPSKQMERIRTGALVNEILPSVWLDGDFLNLKRNIRLANRSEATRLASQLCADADFLASHSIVDYSALVGVFDADTPLTLCQTSWEAACGTRRYQLGIIDVLQHYNMKKSFEHCYKTKCKGERNVSIVPPAEYNSRFKAFVMEGVEYDGISYDAMILGLDDNPTLPLN